MNLLGKKDFFIAFIYSFIFVLFYILINDTFYAEANYFTYRIELMLNQYKVYSNFEYAYGPIFLYIPFVISRIFNIGVEFSYMISYCIFTFITILMLQYISIKILKDRYSIFILIVLAIYFNLSLGLNYNLFRFITAYYLIIKLCEFLDNKSILQILLWQSIFLLVAYSISPEVFLVYLVGSLLVQVLLYRKLKINYKVLFITLGVIFSILIFHFEPRYFDTFLIFGNSASSFKFEFTKIFSIGALVFIFLIVNSFKIISRKIYIENKTIMSIYIISIGFIPAIYSHGVSDWYSVAFNSFGIFLLFYYFIQINIHILFVIGMFLFRAFNDLNYYKTSIGSRIITNLSYTHAIVETNTLQKISNNSLLLKEYFKKLDAEVEIISYLKNSRLTNISMPFTYSKKNILKVLLDDKVFKNTYFSGLVNIKNLDQKNQKSQLILDSNYILIEDFQLDYLNLYEVSNFFILEKKFDGYYLYKRLNK
jgi:hypothetical protein